MNKINPQATCLRLKNVGLKATIGNHYILKDISFNLNWSDRLALIGASGSGKTSLLRLLNRLNEFTDGSILFEDQDIHQIPVIQLRQQITLVAQESKLLGMTVREALAYPLVLRGFAKQAIQQRILTWIEQLHIPQDWLDRTEVQLSVGQRQLVAIARALVIQPKILLLDEPTSALDAGRGNHVLNLLKTLAQDHQITILMTNHQLDLAQQFCDRIIQLGHGQVLSDRPASQVDWAALRQQLIDAERQDAEEWMD